MQVGIIASTIANFSMCHPKEPLTVSDFMPNKKKEKEKTNIEIAESIVQLFPFISIPRDNN
jgi:hypothetical protein